MSLLAYVEKDGTLDQNAGLALFYAAEIVSICFSVLPLRICSCDTILRSKPLEHCMHAALFMKTSVLIACLSAWTDIFLSQDLKSPPLLELNHIHRI